MNTKTNDTAINYALQILANPLQPRLLYWLGFRPFDEVELGQLLPQISTSGVARELAKLADLAIVNPIRNHNDKWSLTEQGTALRELMLSLCVWGQHQMDDAADRPSAQIVEPEKNASLSELVQYGTILDQYFN